MGAKRGKYDKGRDRNSRKPDYLRGLSSSVNKACDDWLRKKGLKALSWKEQLKGKQNEGY